MMDLDVATGVVLSVVLIEAKATNLTHHAVYLYHPVSILATSPIRYVLENPLTSFAIGGIYGIRIGAHTHLH